MVEGPWISFRLATVCVPVVAWNNVEGRHLLWWFLVGSSPRVWWFGVVLGVLYGLASFPLI